jgi:hypothetical protein
MKQRSETMTEMQDVTEALLRALPGSHGKSEIESIRHAMIGVEHVPALIEDPKSIVKAIGVPVQEHSQWTVSLVKRPDSALARARLVIVVIIHFSSCSGVIIVAY